MIEKDYISKWEQDVVDQKMKNVDENLMRFTALENVQESLNNQIVNSKTAKIEEDDIISSAAQSWFQQKN